MLLTAQSAKVQGVPEKKLHNIPQMINVEAFTEK